MNEKNIQIRLQMINFLLYNSKIIINNLNFRPKMYMLLNSCSRNIIFTKSNIFEIAKNAIQNFITWKFKIIVHQNNLLNQLYHLIDVQIKNVLILTHQMVFFKIENKIFYIINEIFNKHYKIKEI